MKLLTEINTIEKLYEYVKTKKCICFGAGRKFDELCNELPGLNGRIAYVLDNNPKLNGLTKRVNDVEYVVCSPDKLKDENVDEILLIITCSFKQEIMEQLASISKLDDMGYCDAEQLLDIAAWEAKKPDFEFKKNSTITIPKKIHYVWFGNNTIPNRLQEYIDGWKKHCPDYEIIRWDERNYDITKHDYMKKAYENKKWSFVSDYARLDIIYNEGGIYFDTDVELIRRPDELLYNDAFIGFERMGTVNSGSGFGARKGFYLIKELRDSYDAIEFVDSNNPNEMVLCPVYETELLVKHGLKLTGDFQIVGDMSVYPVMYFNAKSLYTDTMRITDETISIHHCTWTWAGEKNKLEG